MAQWCSTSSAAQIPTQDTFRRIRQIQTVTIAWMTVEAAVSLAAAWMARSPALLAFGGDSAVGAMARIMLVQAAAQKWNVEPSGCRVGKRQVSGGRHRCGWLRLRWCFLLLQVGCG